MIGLPDEKQVTLEMDYPRRIACLTEETTETLYLLGEQDRIVGPPGIRSGLRKRG